jgi:16S rRNA G966 N2-methylase RsmD
MQREVGETLRKLDGEFDWIFLDPPYDKPALRETIVHEEKVRESTKPGSRPTPHREQRGGYGGLDRALRLLARTSLPAGLVIAEHDARTPPEERYKGASGSLVLVDRRAWGTTAVSFYRFEPAPTEDAPGVEAGEPNEGGGDSPRSQES